MSHAARVAGLGSESPLLRSRHPSLVHRRRNPPRDHPSGLSGPHE
jgi:hypothetical protein